MPRGTIILRCPHRSTEDIATGVTDCQPPDTARQKTLDKGLVLVFLESKPSLRPRLLHRPCE